MDKKYSQDEAGLIGRLCEREIRESYLGFQKDLDKDIQVGEGVWKYKRTMRFLVPRDKEEAESFKEFMEKEGLEPWIGPH